MIKGKQIDSEIAVILTDLSQENDISSIELNIGS